MSDDTLQRVMIGTLWLCAGSLLLPPQFAFSWPLAILLMAVAQLNASLLDEPS